MTTLIYINDDTTEIRQFFRDVRMAGKVSDPYFREGDLPVFICSDPVPEFYGFYRQKAGELKSRFIR